MKSTLKRFWEKTRRWLPGVLLSIIAIFVVLKLVNGANLVEAFSRYNVVYILAAFGLYLVSLAFRALAWRTILDNKAGFWKTFQTLNIGYLLNGVFPLRAGEIGRAFFMGRASGEGPVYVLSTIVIERIFDLMIAAGMLISTLPLALGLEWAKPVAFITLGLVFVGLVVLFLIARNRSKVHDFLGKISDKSVFLKNKVLPQIDSLLNGLGVMTRPDRFLVSVGFMVCAWLIAVVEYYVMLLPISNQPQLWWAALVIGVLAMGIAIPSGPGAIGIFEGSVIAATSLLGIDQSAGLAYAVLIHFLHFGISAVFGFIELMHEGKTLFGVFSELTSKPPAETPANPE